MIDYDYRDFLGKELCVGDYVIYTQNKNKMPGPVQNPLSYGIIEEIGGNNPKWGWHDYDPRIKYPDYPYSVIVKRMTPRADGKHYKEYFPSLAKYLIKVSKEEVTLRILEEGNSDFLKG